MSFLRNDAINRVNLQSGVQALAQGAGQLFLLVFLVRSGVSIAGALLAQAAIVALRFCVRPALLPLARRTGLKPLLLAGAVGQAGQYLILPWVRGPGLPLLAMCAAAALGEVVYYVASNSYVAALGDVHGRGRQAAMGQALAALAGVIAPALGAWALVVAGPRWAFAGVAVVQTLSVAPLLGLPNVAVRPSAAGAWAAARAPALLSAIDGWLDAGFMFVWQLWLFAAFSQSYAAYGGAMALAGLAGAAAGLVIGGHVDEGRGRRATAIGYGAAGLVTLLRAASLHSPWLAALANALGGLVMPLLVPPLTAVTHNLARAAPCPFRVKLASEGGWDVGCFAACLTGAGLAITGAPAWVSVMLAIPAVVAGWAVLRRYYPAANKSPA